VHIKSIFLLFCKKKQKRRQMMSEDKKELSKEEKIEKGKELMKELDNLELSDEEIKGLAAGTSGETFLGYNSCTSGVGQCITSTPLIKRDQELEKK
jgi:hypothetical protein